MNVPLYYESPVGVLAIITNSTHLCAVHFCRTAEPLEQCIPFPLALTVRRQLEAFFNGSRTAFDIPLDPHGTPFQKKVWKALCAIPYGQTKSYKEIAESIGNPHAARAVGNANNKNPIAIIIPCHRVIGSSGTLTGYAAGLSIKQQLLALEQGNTAAHPNDLQKKLAFM